MDKWNHDIVRIKDATGVLIFYCNLCDKCITRKQFQHLVVEGHWQQHLDLVNKEVKASYKANETIDDVSSCFLDESIAESKSKQLASSSLGTATTR